MAEAADLYGRWPKLSFEEKRRIVKPKNDSHLWKQGLCPTHPQHIGEWIKKRRFDLKMTAVECRKILGVDKSTLVNWER